jgi:hypothetical protein
MNRRGQIPDTLQEAGNVKADTLLEYTNGAGQGSLTRFQKNNPKKKKKRRQPPQQRQNS